MTKLFELSNDELLRLRSLLNYASQAIDYWFDGCDINDELDAENKFQKIQCEYFLNKTEECLNFRKLL